MEARGSRITGYSGGGARRVGKSTLVSELAAREYEKHLVIDFSEESDDIKDLFLQYRTDADTFLMYLQAYTGTSLPSKRSVIVFDEAQRFPKARGSSSSLLLMIDMTT